MLSPWYKVGAQYVDGSWEMEEGRLADLIALLLYYSNKLERETLIGRAVFKVRRAIFVYRQKYGIAKSLEHVEHHYDIGNDLFESFLDSKLNYTCADFESDASTLDEAQETKLRNTLFRLDLKAGDKLLEIGCGWGAASRLAAAEYGAVVTALTLSKNQLLYAEQFSAETPETKRPRYLVEDYRQHEMGRQAIYDSILSVGMLEHVGLRQLKTYFKELKRLLKSNGVALVHTIARSHVGVTNSWLAKNIFPGGYIAQVDEILKAADENDFVLTGRTHHYAASNYIRTLRQWSERFDRSWPVFLKHRYPERVRRLYNFYFAASEAAFRELDMHPVQFVFRRKNEIPLS
jgi:cyclopropane-fatty-acyl-phospholipid synthase